MLRVFRTSPHIIKSGGGSVVSYLTHFPKKNAGGGVVFQFYISPLKSDREESVILNYVLPFRNMLEVRGNVLKNLTQFTGKLREGRQLVLNRVLILRKIEIRGSVVSSLPCLAEIAFLCFSSFDGEGGGALSNSTFPPRRVQKATEGSF